MLGDRLMVGQRTLTPSIKVRILVPQPREFKGLRINPQALFCFCGQFAVGWLKTGAFQ